MLFEPVDAGSILFLNFSDFGFERPEFEGPHPVVMISPRSKQKAGTAVVVPITSALGNWDNPSAVEITNETFINASKNGRSFAVCDKPISVALTRLEWYRGPSSSTSSNRPERYTLAGEDLSNIRLAVFKSIQSDEEFSRLFSTNPKHLEHGRMLANRLRERQKKSRKIGRQVVKKR